MRSLRAEILRLRAVADDQENIIRNDVASLREQWKPMNILVNTLSSLIRFQKKCMSGPMH